MNKIYKVIWNKVKGCYVVVSELAKNHTKSSSSGVISTNSKITASVLAALTFTGAYTNVAQANWDYLVWDDSSVGSAQDGSNIKGKKSIYLNPSDGDVNTAGTFSNTNKPITVKEAGNLPINYTTNVGSNALAYASGGVVVGRQAVTNQDRVNTINVADYQNITLTPGIGDAYDFWSVLNDNGRHYNITGGAVAVGTRARGEDSGAVAVGYAARSNLGAVAVGAGARAAAVDSIALGHNAFVEGSDDRSVRSIVIGPFSRFSFNPFGLAKGVTGNGVADSFGDGEGVLVGLKSYVTSQATALGNNVYAVGRSSIAIGSDDNTAYKNEITGYDAQNYFNVVYGHIDPNGDTYGYTYDANTKSLSPASGNAPSGADRSKLRIFSPTISQGNGSIAVGSRSMAFSDGSTAFGTLAFALKKGATAIGTETRSEGAGALAMGSNTYVFTDNSVGVGNNVQVIDPSIDPEKPNTGESHGGGMAYGYKAYAGNQGALAIGRDVYANTKMKYNGVTLIDHNGNLIPEGYGGQRVDIFNALYEAPAEGIARSLINNTPVDPDRPEDHYTQPIAALAYQPYLKVMAAATDSTEIVDHDTRTVHGVPDVVVPTSGKNSIVIGSKSAASGDNSLAIGRGSFARGDNSFAVGSYAYSKANNGLAIGLGSRAMAENGVALGVGAAIASDGSRTGAKDGIAIGTGAVNYGPTSTLMGYNSIINKGSANDVSIGSNVWSKSTGTLTFGNMISALGHDNAKDATGAAKGLVTAKDSVAVGNRVILATGTDSSIAIGSNAAIGNLEYTENQTPDMKISNRFRAIGVDGKPITSITGNNERIFAIDNAMALGANARVMQNIDAAGNVDPIGTGHNSMAIGNNSRAWLNNSTALGVNSMTDYTKAQLDTPAWVAPGAVAILSSDNIGVISVGSRGSERRIVNVAAGAFGTDAVNVSQLRSVYDALDLKLSGATQTTRHYIAVSEKGGEAGNIAANLKRKESYARYVTIRTKVLEYQAREKLFNTTLNPKVMGELRDELNGLNAESDPTRQFTNLTAAMASIPVPQPIPGESEVDRQDRFNDYINKLRAAAEKAAKENPTTLSDAELKELEETTNYQNNRALAPDSLAIGVRSLVKGESAPGLNDGADGGVAYGQHATVGDRAQGGVAIGRYAEVKGSDKELDPKLPGNKINTYTNSMDDRNGNGFSMNTAPLRDNGKPYYGGIAIGDHAIAEGNPSIAIGLDAKAEKNLSLALGTKAKAAASNSVAIGDGANTFGDFSVALGRNATAAHDGSVAIGADSTTKVSKNKALRFKQENENYDNPDYAYSVVSVGSPDGHTVNGNPRKGVFRRIVNLAAGSDPTDAVNVSQLEGLAANEISFKGDGNSVTTKVALGEKDSTDPNRLQFSILGDGDIATAAAGKNVNLSLKKGTVKSGETKVVTGGDVYNAIKGAKPSVVAGANSQDVLTVAGTKSDDLTGNTFTVNVNKTGIKKLAKEAVTVSGDGGVTVTPENNGDNVNYKVAIDTSNLAKKDASNVDPATWRTKLDVYNTGTVDTKLADKADKNLGNIDAAGKKVITDLTDPRRTKVATTNDLTVSDATDASGAATYTVGLSTDTKNKIDNAANQDLGNLTTAGETKIRTEAKKAVNVVGKDEIKVNKTDVNGVDTYTVSADLSSLAKADASNINPATWRTKLNVYDKGETDAAIAKAKTQVKAANGSLVTVTETSQDPSVYELDLNKDTKNKINNLPDDTKGELDKKADKTALDKVVSDGFKVASDKGTASTIPLNTTLTIKGDGTYTEGTVNGSTVSLGLTKAVKDKIDNLPDNVNNELANKANISLDNINEAGKKVIKDMTTKVTASNGLEATNTNDPATGATTYNVALDDKTKAKIDNAADNNLSNITPTGETKIQTEAKKAVKVIAGKNTTVTEGNDGIAKTYAVNVDFSNLANKDGSNITSPATWRQNLDVYSKPETDDAIAKAKTKVKAAANSKIVVDETSKDPSVYELRLDDATNTKIDNLPTNTIEELGKKVDNTRLEKVIADGIKLASNSGTGKVALGDTLTVDGDGKYVTGTAADNKISFALTKEVTNKLDKLPEDTKKELDGKANIALDNIDNDGKKVVKDLAKEAVKVEAANNKVEVTHEDNGNDRTYKVGVKEENFDAEKIKKLIGGVTDSIAEDPANTNDKNVTTGKAVKDYVKTVKDSLVTDGVSFSGNSGSGKTPLGKTTKIEGANGLTTVASQDGEVAKVEVKIDDTTKAKIDKALARDGSNLTDETEKEKLKEKLGIKDLGKEYAKIDASNIDPTNATKWRTTLDVYSKAESDKRRSVVNGAPSGSVVVTPDKNADEANTYTVDLAESVKTKIDDASTKANNAANKDLSNLNPAGDIKIQTEAKKAINIIDGNNTKASKTVVKSADGKVDVDTYKIDVDLSPYDTKESVDKKIKDNKVSVEAVPSSGITVTPENDEKLYKVGFDANQMGATEVTNLKKVLGVENVDLNYKGVTGGTQKVSLSKGLDFQAGTNTSTEVAADGVVKVNLNTDLTGINTISGPATGTPNATKITLGADNKVSFNNAKLAEIAKGTAGTDAVNVDQLNPLAKALNMSAENDGSYKAPTYKVGDATASTVQDALNKINAKASGAIKFSDTANTSEVPLGKTVTFKAGEKAKNFMKVTLTPGTDTFDIDLLDNPTIEGKLTAKGGFDAGSKKITNVADGSDDNDAVNYGQLKPLINKIDNGVSIVANQPIAYVYEDGNSLIPIVKAKKDGEAESKFYKLSDFKDGKVTENATPVDLTSKNVKVSTLQIDTNAPAEMTFTNVKPGKIAENSKEAVNGSQLKTIADVLGTGIGDDGTTVKAPEWHIGPYTYNNINKVVKDVLAGKLARDTYTTKDGTPVLRGKDGKFYKYSEINLDTLQPNENATVVDPKEISLSIINPGEQLDPVKRTTSPIVYRNVGSAVGSDADKVPAATDANAIVKKISGLTDRADLNSSANMADLRNVVKAGISLQGNSGNAIQKELGDTFKVEGKENAKYSATDYSYDNLVTNNDKDTLRIAMKNAPEFKTIALDKPVDGADPTKATISITKDGELAVDSKPLSTVYAGKDAQNLDNDDVTKWREKLNIKDVTKLTLSYKANNANGKQVSLSQGLDFTNGTNTTATVDNDGKVVYSVNSDLKSIKTITNGTGAADETGKTKLSITDDGVELNDKALSGVTKIGKGTTDASIEFSNDKLTVNNKVLTGIADGKIEANSKDAINGGQLKTALDAKADATTVSNLRLKVAGDDTDVTAPKEMALDKVLKIEGAGAKPADKLITTSTPTVGADGNLKVEIDLTDKVKKVLNTAISRTEVSSFVDGSPVRYVLPDGTKLVRDGNNYYKADEVKDLVKVNGAYYEKTDIDPVTGEIKEGKSPKTITPVSAEDLAKVTIKAINPSSEAGTMKLENIASAVATDTPGANTAINESDAKTAVGGLLNKAGTELNSATTVKDLQAVAQAGLDFKATVDTAGTDTNNAIHRPLGTELTIQGGAQPGYKAADFSSENLVTIADKTNNTITVALKKKPTVTGLTIQDDNKGITMELTPDKGGIHLTKEPNVAGDNNVVISGVKDDLNDPTSAVSRGSLKNLVDKLNPNFHVLNNLYNGVEGGTMVYTTKEGKPLVKVDGNFYDADVVKNLKLANNGLYYPVAEVDENGNPKETAVPHDFSGETAIQAKDIVISSVNPDGTTTNPANINNVASGLDLANMADKDAANRKAIGADNAQKAIAGENKDGKGGLLAKAGADLNKVATVGDLQAVAQAGLDVAGAVDTTGAAANNTIHSELGTKVSIVGGVDAAKYKAEDFDSSNLTTVVDKDAKTIRVAMKNAPSFKEITVGKETDGSDKVTITPGKDAKGEPTVTLKGGNTGAKDVEIKGVADGKENNSAINKGQLDTAIKNVRDELGLTPTNGTDGKDGSVGPAGKDGLDGKSILEKVQGIRDGEAGTMVYTDKDGHRVTRVGENFYKPEDIKDKKLVDGKWYDAKDIDPKTGKVLDGRNPLATPPTKVEASEVKISAVNAETGATTTPSTISNVKSGLGLTGKADNTAGNTTNLETPAAINETAAKAVIKDLATKSGKDLNNVATVGDLQAVTVAGLDFASNNAKDKTNAKPAGEEQVVHKNLSEKLSIIGKQGAQFSADEYSADNVVTTVDNGAIQVNFKKAPTFTGLGLSNGKDGAAGKVITMTPDDKGETITLRGPKGADGKDGKVVVNGGKDGDTPDSFVTKGRIDNLLKEVIGLNGKDGVAGRNGETGPAGKDGLNENRTAIDKLNALRGGEAGPVVYTDDQGNRVVRDGNDYYKADALKDLTKGADGKFYNSKDFKDAVKVGNDYYKPGDVDEAGNAKPDAKPLAPVTIPEGAKVDKEKVSLSTVNPDGSTTEPVALKNVASALGIDPKDVATTPIAADKAKALVGGTVPAGETDPKGGLLQATGADLNKVATKADLQAVAVAGLDFATNNAKDATNTVAEGHAQSIHKNLSEKLSIIGKKDAQFNGDEYSADNVVTTVADGAVQVNFKKAPTFTGLGLSNGKDGEDGKVITITPDANGETITLTGPKGADGQPGKVVIKGGKDGDTPDSFVTKGSVDEIVKKIIGTNGKDGKDGLTINGQNGVAGRDGATGPAGKDGLSPDRNINDRINALRGGEAGPVVYTDDKGERVVRDGNEYYKADALKELTKGENGNFYNTKDFKDAVKVGNDYYKPGDVDETGKVKPDAQPLAPVTIPEAAKVDKDKVSLSTVNPDGSTTEPVALKNVASALGIDANTVATAPIATDKAKELVAGKAKTPNGPLEGGLVKATGADLNKVANKADLQALAVAGMDFTGNVGETNANDKTVHRNLGEGVSIVGGAADYVAANFSGDNLATMANPTTGTITITMKKAPEFTGLDLSNGKTDGDKKVINIKPDANGETIALTGPKGADGQPGKVVITGGKDGTTADSFVTKGALDKLKDTLGLSGNSSLESKTSPAIHDGLNGKSILEKVAADRDGLTGTMVYTDKAGERLVAIDGKYYKANVLDGLKLANDGKYYDADKVDANGKAADGEAAHVFTNPVDASDIIISAVSPEDAKDTKAPVNIGNVASSLGITPTEVASPTVISADRAKKLVGGEAPKEGEAKAGGLLQATGADLNRVATKADLQAVARAGLDFKDNAGNVAHKDLSEELGILGGTNYTADFSGENIATKVDNGNILIGMAKQPTLEGLKLRGKDGVDGKDGKIITITPDAKGETITITGPKGADGKDGKVVIQGVKEGDTPDSVVTKETITKLIKDIDAGKVGKDGTNGVAGRDGDRGPAGKDGLTPGYNNTDRINALRNGEAGPVVYTDQDGNRVVRDGDTFYKADALKGLVKGEDGKFYKASELDGATYDKAQNKYVKDGQEVASTKIDEKDKVDSKNVSLSTVSPDGETTKPVALKNVASALGIKSEDVATAPIAADKAKALVGGEKVADGKVTKEGLLQAKGADLNKVATKGDLQAVAVAGLDFAANNDKDDNAQSVHKNLSETVSIIGKADAKYDADVYSADNLVTTIADGAIQVNMKKAPTFTSLGLSNGKDGKDGKVITLTPDANGETLTIAGPKGADGQPGKVVIDGVKDGTTPDSVVTKGALDKIVKQINDGIVGKDGQNGVAGRDGSQGPAGKDGLVPNRNNTDRINALRGGEAGTVVYTDPEGNRVVRDGKVFYKADALKDLTKGEDGKFYKADAFKDAVQGKDGKYYPEGSLDKDGNAKADAVPLAPQTVPDDAKVKAEDVSLSTVSPNGETKEVVVLKNVASSLGIQPEDVKDKPIEVEKAKKVINGENGLLQAKGTDLNKVATKGDLQAVAVAGLDFDANGTAKDTANTTHKNLGERVGVLGGGLYYAEKFSSENIATKIDNGNIVIGLAKTPSFDGINFGGKKLLTTVDGDLVYNGNKVVTGEAGFYVKDKSNNRFYVKLGETLMLEGINVEVDAKGESTGGKRGRTGVNTPVADINNPGSEHSATVVHGDKIDTGTDTNLDNNSRTAGKVTFDVKYKELTVQEGPNKPKVEIKDGGITTDNANGKTVNINNGSITTNNGEGKTVTINDGGITADSGNGKKVEIKDGNITINNGGLDKFGDKDAVTKEYVDNRLDKSLDVVDKVVSQVGDKISEVHRQASAGTASAMASASIPQIINSDQRQILGFGMGSYHGQQAMAVGVSGTNRNRDIVYKVAGTVDSTGAYGFTAGIGFTFGPKDSNEHTDIRPGDFNRRLDRLETQSAEIEALKVENKELKQRIDDLVKIIETKLDKK